MIRKNKSRHAILALLSIGPRSGYDIERDIRRMISHFWNESFGQIYPALKALVGDGLATVHEEEQDGRPNRKVYTITKQGRTVVRRWLETPPDPPPVRNEMLLKLFVGWQVPEETLETHIAELLQHFSSQLAEFEVLEQIINDLVSETPDAIYWYMTLRSGQLYMEARRQWCEETLVLLRELAQQQPAKKHTTAARTKQMAKSMVAAHKAVQAVEEQLAHEEAKR